MTSNCPSPVENLVASLQSQKTLHLGRYDSHHRPKLPSMPPTTTSNGSGTAVCASLVAKMSAHVPMPTNCVVVTMARAVTWA
jgi:hypothetical protein